MDQLNIPGERRLSLLVFGMMTQGACFATLSDGGVAWRLSLAGLDWAGGGGDKNGYSDS